MSLRLFVAIPVPDAIADHLVLLQRAVGGAAWRPRENFHLTLRFFGEIDEMLARDLDDALGQIVAAPFEMRLSGVGSFGGREPSALWAGAEAPPVLARLASACERAARRAGGTRRLSDASARRARLPTSRREMQKRRRRRRRAATRA